jgi:transposase-like protein
VIQYSLTVVSSPDNPPPQPIAPQHFFPFHFCESVTTSLLRIRHPSSRFYRRATLQIRDIRDPTLYNVRMPRTVHTARVTRTTTRPHSGVKPPERCPSCNSTKVGPKGTRAKKLEMVRLYRCRGCGRTFTPGPRAICNKTYPLNEILEAFTIYNRGNSPEDTSRRRFCQDC